MYLHCRQCMQEKPDGISPADWSKLDVGSTPIGFQVWCRRCEANVLHIDFEGHTHPANSKRLDATEH
jgi:hypothetical protein